MPGCGPCTACCSPGSRCCSCAWHSPRPCSCSSSPTSTVASCPNEITVGGTVAGLIASALVFPPGFQSALIGVLLGGGVLWATGEAYERLRGVEGMGMGDVKMLAMIGAVLGWPLMLLTLVGLLHRRRTHRCHPAGLQGRREDHRAPVRLVPGTGRAGGVPRGTTGPGLVSWVLPLMPIVTYSVARGPARVPRASCWRTRCAARPVDRSTSRRHASVAAPARPGLASAMTDALTRMRGQELAQQARFEALEGFLHQVVESLPHGLFVLGRDGNLRVANGEALRWLGLRESVEGQVLWTLDGTEPLRAVAQDCLRADARRDASLVGPGAPGAAVPVIAVPLRDSGRRRRRRAVPGARRARLLEAPIPDVGATPRREASRIRDAASTSPESRSTRTRVAAIRAHMRSRSRLARPLATSKGMSMPSRCARGSSLLEAVIAAALLATVLTGVLPLVTTAVAGTTAARADLMAAHLARQRLAQLQSLTHATLPSGVIADDSSRLDRGRRVHAWRTWPPAQRARRRCRRRPRRGWTGWMSTARGWRPARKPPPGARFSRRWGIVATGGDGCLRLWVEAAPLASVEWRSCRPCREPAVSLGNGGAMTIAHVHRRSATAVRA